MIKGLGDYNIFNISYGAFSGGGNASATAVAGEPAKAQGGVDAAKAAGAFSFGNSNAAKAAGALSFGNSNAAKAAGAVSFGSDNAAKTAGSFGVPGVKISTEHIDPRESGKTPETTVKAGRKSSPAECETCAERKYQDGSNENDVSFKSPTHISPNNAGAAVRAHENMHVQNAYQKAGKEGGKVLQASVAIHTAVCPECGRVYVSGGKTTTAIASPVDDGNSKNPYKQQAKAIGALFNGANVNYRA